MLKNTKLKNILLTGGDVVPTVLPANESEQHDTSVGITGYTVRVSSASCWS